MASIDVRDAFLQVEQTDPILVCLQNEPFVINGQAVVSSFAEVLERAQGFRVFFSAEWYLQELTGHDPHSC